jgi:hypothetical protein
MDMYDERYCCANAAECQHMAAITRNEQERLTWLEMGESWLRLARVNESSTANRKETARAA